MMDDNQVAPTLPLVGCQGLEQFLLLAKAARGPAAVDLVKRALEAPGVYVFGELLETECVRELSEGPDASYARLLELFAYGTYGDYKKEVDSLPPLSPPQLKKLKHLSIISLASKCQTIPYSTLLRELDIQDLRTLEDLIIEAIYAGIMQAKLDQRNGQVTARAHCHGENVSMHILGFLCYVAMVTAQLGVERCIGRDIKMAEVDSMISTLENWCTNCASVLLVVEAEMTRADKLKADSVKEKERHETEMKQLLQTLKMTASDSDEQPMRDGGLGGLFSTRQQSPRKGLRGAGTKPRKK